MLSIIPESIFINMEKVSKNSTSRKPKKELFARAGLKPVTPPSREEAVKAESSPVTESAPVKAEPEAKLQVNIVSAPEFDPSAYVRDTYGPIAEPLSCLKAILRELVIMNHK